MAEKLITPSDLRKQAQELIKAGKMPSPEEFAHMMDKARKDYVPKLKRLRENEKQK